jgi:hypothetical protein
MKRRSTWKVFAVFLASALTSACTAQQLAPGWNGTWKLNPSKGNFLGPVITISISENGEYRYDDQYSGFTFRCDGTDRPTGNNRTVACMKSSPSVLDLTRKENGVKASVSHWELSADGKVLTATATALRPTGPVVTSQIVASRMSGSKDFAGQWRDTSYLQRHADLTVRLDSHAMHIGYPTTGQSIDAPLNGADGAVQGQHPEGLTCTARIVGQREFLLLMKRGGKVLTQDSLELSNDGRAITYSWWNPDRPTDKATLVYDRK